MICGTGDSETPAQPSSTTDEAAEPYRQRPSQQSSSRGGCPPLPHIITSAKRWSESDERGGLCRVLSFNLEIHAVDCKLSGPALVLLSHWNPRPGAS